jgi:hypothetical protein
VVKGKGAGGFGQKALLLPPPRIRTEGGRRPCGGGRPAPIPGELGHGGGRAVGQNDEGFMGDRFPYLPWPVVARGGGSTGGGGLEAASLGGGGVPGSRGAELGLWRCEVG